MSQNCAASPRLLFRGVLWIWRSWPISFPRGLRSNLLADIYQLGRWWGANVVSPWLSAAEAAAVRGRSDLTGRRTGCVSVKAKAFSLQLSDTPCYSTTAPPSSSSSSPVPLCRLILLSICTSDQFKHFYSTPQSPLTYGRYSWVRCRVTDAACQRAEDVLRLHDGGKAAVRPESNLVCWKGEK